MTSSSAVPAAVPMELRAPASDAPWAPLLPWLAAAAALILTLAGLVIWLARERQVALETVRLESVSVLRAQQVSGWINASQAQFRFLSRTPLWPELLARWQDQGDEKARTLLFDRLREYAAGHGFARLFVLDATDPNLPLGEAASDPIAPALREAAQRALATRAPAFTDLYRSRSRSDDNALQLDFVLPMLASAPPNGAPVRWLVVVRMDPRVSLLPLLDAWPDSRSAVQTQLVRREGDFLLGPYARTPVPLSRPGLLVGQVVRGQAPAGKALFANDFAGRPVLGVVQPVAGTPWWLVSRVQSDEVMSPVWETAGWVGLAAALAFVLLGVAANLVRQRRALLGAVAERDRQAQRLRALALVEGIANSSPDAIYAKDGQGRYVVFNPAASRLTGRRANHAIGRRDAELFDAASSALFAAHEARVIDAGRAMEFEERVHGPDGERVLQVVRGPLNDEAGRAVGSFGVARDVTEVRRIEAEVEQHRRRIDELVQSRTTEGVPDSVAALITLRGPGRVAYWDASLRCRYVNDVYCEWFGVKREEVIGRTVQEIYKPDFFSERLDRVQRALAGEAQQFERVEVSAGGTRAVTWVHYIPDGAPGEVRGLFVLATDITQMKEAERRQRMVIDELAAARASAEAANIAKSVFLANMSHEIRTPLSAILGLTHLLQDPREPPTAAQAQRLRGIDEAAAHLLQVVDDILDLSKIEAGRVVLEAVPFSLDALLQRSFSLVAPRARARGLELVIAREPAPDALRGDPTRLSQAMVNLLSNAVKFTSAGHVTLHCRVLSQVPGRVHLCFEVEDSGVGIEADKQALLFQAFSQADSSTSRQFGGTGLGLAITRRLAGLMNGDVGLSSEFGRGSRFWFSAQLGVDDPTPVPATRACLAGQTAWLLQPHQATALALERGLRTMGMACVVARSLDEAAALGEAAPPAVIVCDVDLPGLDGAETLRARWPQVPVVWLLDEMAPWAPDPGTPDVAAVAKPVGIHALCQALEAVRGAAPPRAPAPPPPVVTAETLRASHGGTRILLVEDNPVNREVGVALLSAAGLAVDTAADGEQAVARVAEDSYALVLMDMQMPVMDGLAATRAIRAMAQGRALPIVAMTANAFGEDRDACLAAGMNDYIAKPVEPSRLYETLLRWLAPQAVGGAGASA